MYDKFLKLKEEKKWLFYLLIIPFGVVCLLELYNKYLVNSGKQIVKDAEKADAKLKDEQEDADNKADAHKAEADKIEENIENIKPDENWHKNE